MLFGYETMKFYPSFETSPVRIGGAGGALHKGGFGKMLAPRGAITWKRAEDFLMTRSLMFQDLFDPTAMARYVLFLLNWIGKEQMSGPDIALDKLFLYYRVGRWSSAIDACCYGCTRPQPIQDNEFARACLRVAEPIKLNDEFTYGLLRRLAPSLVDVPFAGGRWKFEMHGPRPGDQEEGWLRRSPVVARAGTRGAFNWRNTWTTDLYPTFVEQIFSDSRATALFELMDRQRLLSWFESMKGQSPSTRQTTLAWAAHSASVLLSNRWLERDAPGQPVNVGIPPVGEC
jgi:hypothetical protein